MLELHVPNATVQTGVVPVSWCVDRETLAALAERGVADPQLLIVISQARPHGRRQEIRKIVPLKDLMTYVEFRSSGENTVVAAVFAGTDRWMRQTFLRRSYGDWDTHVLGAEGEVCVGSIVDDRLIASSAPLRVDVPTECFAKKPFDAGWVNLMLPGAAENQCDFRRRRLFAYTVQPVAALVVWLMRLCFATALLLIGRSVSLKPLYRPLRYETHDVWDDADGWYIVPPYGSPLRYLRLAFTPAFLLVAAGIMSGIGRSGAYMIFGVLLFCLMTMSLILLVLGAAALLQYWSERARRVSGTIRTLPEGAVPWYLREQEQSELLCAAGRGPRTGVGDVPRRYRSLRLHFEGIKSKVCRPFSS